VTSATPALAGPDGDLTGGELADAATTATARWALAGRDRVLVTTPLTGLSTAVVGLLAPLVAGAAVVLVRHSDRADEATGTRRLTDEGVTALAPAPGNPALTQGFRHSGPRHLD